MSTVIAARETPSVELSAQESAAKIETLPDAASKLQAYKTLVDQHAAQNGVPAGLARAVVTMESRYNPQAHHGPNVGLMQISTQTARGMGYGGPAAGLMNPDINLHYGIRYLAQAYRLARGDTCRTVLKYQAGHRAISMTPAAQRYCTKVRILMAKA